MGPIPVDIVKAARNAFDAFQHGDDTSDPSTYCYTFDVKPLSFFMLDSRTFRTGTVDNMHGLRSEHVRAYHDWVQRMIDTPKSVPVLVTGPSLFQAAKTSRRSFDLNFANIREYPSIMTGLLRLSRAGRTPLALTGDVHYPRVVRATYRPGSHSRLWAPIYEVIASPASLVALQRQSATKPDKSDTFTLNTQADMSLNCNKHWPPTGHALIHDHVAIVKFTHTNTGLRVAVRYWLVPHAGRVPRYYDAPPFVLTHATEANLAPNADPIRPPGATADTDELPQPILEVP